MPSIVFDEVRKNFGAFKAVKGVSLEIRDREFIAMLGPSGCGKTTCLRMLAGLEEPTDGRILLDGQDITHVPPRKRDIAMVFQNYALYPHMSVRANLEIGLKYRRVPAADMAIRVDEAAKLMEIEALLNRRPGQLSGGQRQRVALGRAIVRRPQALLMDEPLSNLDAALRSRMRIDLKLLQQRIAVTTIYVTHDQREAMSMADRIAVMSGGCLMQFDKPEVVFSKPANRFVAQFVGSPAVNLLPAHFRNTGPEGAIEAGTFSFPLKETAPAELRSVNLEVGIRPHFLRLGSIAGCAAATGQVVVIEPLGTETNVHVAIGGATIVLVVDPRQAPSVGDTVKISCAPSDIYVFDAADGRLISHGL